MSEYIKKEELFEKMQESGSQFFDYSEVVELADSVPTYSFPDREKGEWKKIYLDHASMGKRPSILYCSVCCRCIAYPTNYCPNCGADMRGK